MLLYLLRGMNFHLTGPRQGAYTMARILDVVMKLPEHVSSVRTSCQDATHVLCCCHKCWTTCIEMYQWLQVELTLNGRA